MTPVRVFCITSDDQTILMPMTALSDLKIRLLMDAEEKQAVKDGAIRVHSIGPARFIAMGLDIEETQCVKLLNLSKT